MENKIWLSEFLEKFKTSIDGKEDAVLEIKNAVIKARANGNNIFFAGNGASTTIASHASLDYMNQLGIKSLCLNDPNVITCFANDFGYDEVFARALKIYGKPGDYVILISSSGMSKNVIAAAKIARQMGITIISLTGFSEDNELKSLSDINLWIDSKIYNIIECAHMLMLVSVCDMIVSEDPAKVGLHGIKI